jgi:hypothetical protein
MADDHATEAAKRQLAADREASDKSREQFLERMKGKPTPTQEENDMAVLGAPVFEKEDDGSGPDPNMTRSVEAGKPGVYQTRQAQPQARPAAPRPNVPRE